MKPGNPMPTPAIRSAGGATFTYWIKHPVQTLTLDVLDAKGQVIRTFTGAVRLAADDNLDITDSSRSLARSDRLGHVFQPCFCADVHV